MATINCVNTKAKSKVALKRVINYVMQIEKTDERLVSGKDLMHESAFDEMVLIKKQYNKIGGRQYLHMVQSFSPDENIDYNTAHEIALKLAEHYEGFQVLVATHKDKEHIHSHFIINSVNMDTGLKIQQSFKQLNAVMDKSDTLCKQYGLSVIEDRKFGRHISRNEYHVAMKGESWKMDLINNIDTAIANTTTKDEFIIFMGGRGYGVTWQDSRKYITYTAPDGKKCRDNKLHDNKYTKERMENVYNSRKNEKRISGTTKRASRGIYKTPCNNTYTNTMGDDDKIIIGSDSSKSRQPTTRYEAAPRSSQQNSSTTHRQNREDGLSKLHNNGENNNSQYEPDINEHQGVQFEQFGNNEKDNQLESNIKNNGDLANDIIGAINLANNLLSNNSTRSKKRTKAYSNDLSKEAKREKSKNEKRSSSWDYDR